MLVYRYCTDFKLREHTAIFLEMLTLHNVMGTYYVHGNDYTTRFSMIWYCVLHCVFTVPRKGVLKLESINLRRINLLQGFMYTLLYRWVLPCPRSQNTPHTPAPFTSVRL